MNLQQLKQYLFLFIPGLEVSGSGGNEDVVRVPVQAGNCGTDWLLDVLAHPPVILLLKVTHRDCPRATAHSKLVLWDKK